VTGVHVAVTQADGAAIEEGAAVETPAESGRWMYTATAAVPTGTTVRPSTAPSTSFRAGLRTGIAVTATDRPGGLGEAAQEKAL
jgi:hypothetical protein